MHGCVSTKGLSNSYALLVVGFALRLAFAHAHTYTPKLNPTAVGVELGNGVGSVVGKGEGIVVGSGDGNGDGGVVGKGDGMAVGVLVGNGEGGVVGSGVGTWGRCDGISGCEFSLKCLSTGTTQNGPVIVRMTCWDVRMEAVSRCDLKFVFALSLNVLAKTGQDSGQ